MKIIHLWPEKIQASEGHVTLRATLELERGDDLRFSYGDASRTVKDHRTELWYRVPEAFAPRLTQRCDPFVVATVMLAMQRAEQLHIHGEVSPSLLSNLEEFQAVWSSWRPKTYRFVDIRTDCEREGMKPTEDRAISAFSGGVDSCFTAWRHRIGQCGRLQQPLHTGLMVHGFDIPLVEREMFERAAARSQRILSSVGVELMPIATNIRQVIPLDWEESFGTATASTLMLFAGYYSTGLIPASHPYKALEFRYGSNPISDRLLSSTNFEIVHDGAGSDRAAKIRAISQWPEAVQYLRVCWEGQQKDRNCGTCEKCIRNILNFRVIGIDNPPCFDRPVSNAEIRSLKVRGASLSALKNLYHSAQKAQIADSWVTDLDSCIQRNQRLENLRRFLPPRVRRYI
jgi:hypothetical protein